MKILRFQILILILLVVFFNFASKSLAYSKSLTFDTSKNYQAIVLGEIIKKETEKIGNFWITKYKLKTRKWFYKNSKTEKSKYITIKILGADLPERGIVIKSSVSPRYIPVNKDAVFLLEENSRKQKDVFSLSNNGVIYGEELNMFKNLKSLEFRNNEFVPIYKGKQK